MAVTESMTCISLTATAALTQYEIVKFADTGVSNNVVVATAATEKNIIGIVQNDPGAGETACVAIGGRALCKAGGAIDAGDLITTDAAGEGVATTTAGNIVIGTALTDAADGDIFAINIDKMTIHA